MPCSPLGCTPRRCHSKARASVRQHHTLPPCSASVSHMGWFGWRGHAGQEVSTKVSCKKLLEILDRPHDHLVKDLRLCCRVDLVPRERDGQPTRPVAQRSSTLGLCPCGAPAKGSGQVTGDQVGRVRERLLIDPHRCALLGHGPGRPVLPSSHTAALTSAPAASCPICRQPQALMQHAW